MSFIARGLDAVVAELFPGWAARRLGARLQVHLLRQARAFDAGQPDRLSGRGAPPRSGPNAKGRKERIPTLAQARDLYRRNPYARGAVNSIVANLVGTGIRPAARVTTPRLGAPRESFNDTADSLWREWARGCDSTGRRSFYRTQAQVMREFFVAGEAFLRLSTPRDARPVPLAVDLIAAERIADLDRPRLQSGGRIVQGVEFDAGGQIVAYHIHREHPGESTSFSAAADRVPAEQIIHLFDETEAGQVRGMTRFLTIAGTCEAMMQWLDWVMAKERTASALAIMIRQNLPGMNFINTGNSEDESDDEDNALGQLEGAMILRGKPGEDITGVSSGIQGANVDQLSTVFLRQIARGFDCAYELVARDLTRVTYLSARQGENQDRRHWEPQQEGLNETVNVPIWNAFIGAAALAGALKVPAGRLKEYQSVAFIRPGWDWIDPTKDVKGTIDSVRAGLRSPIEEIAKKGGDAYQILRDIALYKSWCEELGLDHLTILLPEKPAAPAQDPEAPDDPNQETSSDASDQAA